MPLALRLVLVLLVGYALVCGLVWLFQERLVYFPGPPPGVTPADSGLEHRELELATEDGERLHAWFVPKAEAARAVLVCHGNAGSIAQRIALARAFHELGCSVLLFDYRGFGKSSGSPGEDGTYLDGEAAWAHLVESEGLAAHTIVLYGESLGVAVALELARRHPAAALIAESGFTSLPDMAAVVYPFLPARWLARIRYDNLAKIGALGKPLLILHSPADEIVPVAHAERLFAAAREPKRLVLTGGGHNDGGFQQRPEWRAEVAQFLASLEGPR
jgi:fermentation-respiration switch protein FrsA (DUF1100 family)